MTSAMQMNALFPRLAKVFLCASALTLLLCVIQPHDHDKCDKRDHSHSDATCVACKIHGTLGGVPPASPAVHQIVVALRPVPPPLFREFLCTLSIISSGTPRAPPLLP